MKKISFHPTVLQVTYVFIYVILFALIIYIPTLINGPVHITNKLILEEETIEGSLLGMLFILSIIILNLYKREVFRHKELISKINHDKKRVEERLIHADQYIGMVNAQIQEINSIFNRIDKYPETKADLKNSFRFFGERVLGIVNIDWVLFRIINSDTQRTIMERFETRQGCMLSCPQVSNKMIIENQPIVPFTSVISNPENLNILAFCILPVDTIHDEQRIVIQAIINEITKLFVIVSSSYYRKGNEIFENNSSSKKQVLSAVVTRII